MSLEITKRNVIEILDKNKELEIPYFQREYTWTFKNNIQTLLDDINTFNDDYYLGSIILKRKLIIDGQQRISTILLILKALNYYLKDNVLDHILNSFEFNSFNTLNKQYLQDIIKGKFDDSNNLKEDNLYYYNYQQLLAYFQNLSEASRVDFYNKLKHVYFSEINVSDQTDETLLFDHINSTGKPLTSYDLLKNHLLYEIQKANHYDVDKLETCIKRLDNISYFMSKNKINNDELDKYRNDLITNFLAYYTGNKVNKNYSTVYQKYRKYYDEAKLNANEFFNLFINFGLYYKFFYNSEYLKYSFYKPIVIIKNYFENYMSLLIDIMIQNSSIMHDEIIINKDHEDNIAKCLLMVEKYIVYRRFDDNANDKTITRFIPRIPKLIDDIRNRFSLDYQQGLYFILLAYCENNYEYSYRICNIETFKERVLNKDIYNTDATFVKKLLIRLNISGKFASNNDLSVLDSYNIEHVVSQNGKEVKNCPNNLKTQLIIRINTIGNLILIYSPLNSSIKNSDYCIKVNEYIKCNTLPLTSYLTKTYPNEFDSNNIIEMSNYIYELCDQIWNHIDYESDIDEIKLNQIYSYINKISTTKKQEAKEEYAYNISSYCKTINESILKDINSWIQALKMYFVDRKSQENCEEIIFHSSNKGWIINNLCKYLDLTDFKKNKMTSTEFNNFLNNNYDEIRKFRDTVLKSIN